MEWEIDKLNDQKIILRLPTYGVCQIFYDKREDDFLAIIRGNYPQTHYSQMYHDTLRAAKQWIKKEMLRKFDVEKRRLNTQFKILKLLMDELQNLSTDEEDPLERKPKEKEFSDNFVEFLRYVVEEDDDIYAPGVQECYQLDVLKKDISSYAYYVFLECHDGYMSIRLMRDFSDLQKFYVESKGDDANSIYVFDLKADKDITKKIKITVEIVDD